MPFALVQTVAPTVGPIELARAKEHLRVVGNDEDALIADMLAGAILAAQRECGRVLAGSATYALYLDDFPRKADEDGVGVIRLPIGPVLSLTSIVYRDDAGNTQTLAGSNYAVGLQTGRILPVNCWPATDPEALENVTVTFLAGYAQSSLVPKDAIAAVLLILADRYENRGDEGGQADRPIPLAALRLLNNLRDGNHW